MKENIWIFNHYATNMFFDNGGRHYNFSKFLIKEEYKVSIFCASTIHNSTSNIDTLGQIYLEDRVNDIPFVFVNTPDYKGNGNKRIKNMIVFYRNLFIVAKEYAKKYGKPDIILASSVHPLTLVAGIRIAKKLRVPCICELRDLWPETIVAYEFLENNSLIAKILYLGEKWIYKKADKLIFTMEGGKDYIIEKGWDKEHGGPIDLKKVFHINNGVDLEIFENNKKNYVLEDEDLNNNQTFKVIYTGSIRFVNNVKSIIDAAQVIKKRGINNIEFLIFGDGNNREFLEKYCIEHNINNVKFKGLVDKNRIPYILSKSNLNIIHFKQNKIKKYGASLNKLFEYFASGKPILSDCEFGYDLVKRYNSGIVFDNATSEQLAEAIISFYRMPEDEYNNYCQNARNAARNFDFKLLTEKLENLFY